MQLPLHFYADYFVLYRCLGHGLKICIWFTYNNQIISVTFFTVDLSHLFSQSESILGNLCMQLLLHFYADYFTGVKVMV